MSIQRIADRTSLSKSTLYYHFDDKYDLLMQFSEEFLSWYLERLVEEYEGDAQETLSRLLDIVLLGEADDGVLFEDVFAPGYIATILEMRAQAVRDQEMRTYVTVTDEVMRDHLVALIEDGIEDGTFIDVDPEATAACCLSSSKAGSCSGRAKKTPNGWLPFATLQTRISRRLSSTNSPTGDESPHPATMSLLSVLVSVYHSPTGSSI